MTKQEMITEATKLLKNCRVCAVSSLTENGYPRICILMPLKNEGIKTFYFSTATSSNKVRHYRNNLKGGVTFFYGGDSVTLTGIMEIVEDKKIKDDLWNDALAKHFPHGGKDDPEYTIIKFTSSEATIYINDYFDTILI